ncbi:Minichromosome maintenance domain-containing protein 2 [Gaertneriomyces sp. JEL0708]|nr:Minichromosome maintenance domain-containing protein 2 [Gaertneriomyces sp. JEL0708]
MLDACPHILGLFSLVSVPADVEESAMLNGPDAESPRKAVNLLFVTDCYVPALSRLVSTAAGYRRSAKWHHGTERKHSTLLNILRNEGKSVEQCIQASVVAQAKDGILIVGLDKLRKTQIKDLTDVLQMLPHKALISGDQSLSLQHNFALWGEVSSNGAKMDKKAKAADTFSLEVIVIDMERLTSAVNSRPTHSQNQLSNDLKPILGKFDILLNFHSSAKEAIDVLLSTHILNEELKSDGTPAEDRRDFQRITPTEFEQFIYIASSIHVKLSPECQTLLRLYFSALRRLCGRLVSGMDSMFTTLETLVRISCSHAKLCLRDTAVVDDGLVSILLVEESMALAFGVSILGFTSLPQDQENLHFLFGPQRNLRSTVPDDDQMDLDSDDDDEGDTEAEKAFNRRVKRPVSIDLP